MPDTPSTEEMFGTLSLICDSTPKHDSDKLDYGGIMVSDVSREAPPSTEVNPEDARSIAREPEPDDDPGDSAQGADERALWAQSVTGRPGGPVKPGTEEAFYLLATYCFDLQRKMEYLFKASRGFALLGDPAIARQLLADERRINAPNLTWKQRALRAETRMIELQRELGKEHLRLLKQVAGSNPSRDGGQGPPPGQGGKAPDGPR